MVIYTPFLDALNDRRHLSACSSDHYGLAYASHPVLMKRLVLSCCTTRSRPARRLFALHRLRRSAVLQAPSRAAMTDAVRIGRTRSRLYSCGERLACWFFAGGRRIAVSSYATFCQCALIATFAFALLLGGVAVPSRYLAHRTGSAACRIFALRSMMRSGSRASVRATPHIGIRVASTLQSACLVSRRTRWL